MAHGQPENLYAKAGVDYDQLDPAKKIAQGYAESTVRTSPHGYLQVAATRGESAFVVDVGPHMIATLSEGLGTRNLVADAMRKITGHTYYESIGYSTAATILNDLTTVGARPLVVSAFWAAGSSKWFADLQRVEDLSRGWAQACIDADASTVWGGGETQALSGLIRSHRALMAGSAMGIIDPKERLITADQLQIGDLIVLAPSTGIHDNGLTLSRQIASDVPRGYRTKLLDGSSYGESLLVPTRLYSPLIQTLLDAGVSLHYLANISGHGWKKMMRAPQENFSYVVDQIPTPQPVFDFITSKTEMSPEEAYSTFNMGAGYALFIPESQAQRAVQIAHTTQGYDLLVAGSVEKGPKQVVIRPNGVTYDGASLNLR